MTKFLIIRFSSIGDIIQCMGIIGGIRERFADVEIHWITRKDMVGTLSMDGRIDKIWAFDKGTGLAGLLKMAADLRKEHFDYIYDAHSNIRSNILKLIVSPLPFVKPYVALRSKERGKRFLLFKLGINHFDKPFRGMVSFQKPLKKWGITHFPDNYHDWHFPDEIRSKYENFVTKDMITLVPSANWEMKRWPVSYWKELVAPQIAGANVFKLLKSLQITGAVAASVKDPVWKYKWVQAHEPENFKRVHKWLDVKEFLICKMTGEFVMTQDSAFAGLINPVLEGLHSISSSFVSRISSAHLKA